MDPLLEIAELCVRMDKATSVTAVRKLLTAAAELFGASYYLFAMRGGKTVSPPVQLVISTYPKRWQDRYNEMGALAFDPILAKAFQFQGPFRWDGLHQGEQQIALRRESVRNGMEFGFSCPDRGPDASVAILSFCGPVPIAPDPGQWQRTSSSAALLAATTHRAVSRFLESRAARRKAGRDALTQAERDSLRLMAMGMTAERAASVLGVKPRTVRYYLDRAALKLGVTTRKQAVMKAVSEGIVDTRRFPEQGFGDDTEKYV